MLVHLITYHMFICHVFHPDEREDLDLIMDHTRTHRTYQLDDELQPSQPQQDIHVEEKHENQDDTGE